MRKLFLALIPMLAIGCGCRKTSEEIRTQQNAQVPVLICEKDGVRLWKIADKTPGGGVGYVYFTTPAGDVEWEVSHGDDPPTRHQVPAGKQKK
jgi:hypothetical protein